MSSFCIPSRCQANAYRDVRKNQEIVLLIPCVVCLIIPVINGHIICAKDSNNIMKDSNTIIKYFYLCHGEKP
jgi:hypothetical protein